MLRLTIANRTHQAGLTLFNVAKKVIGCLVIELIETKK